MVEPNNVQTGYADINGGKLYYEVAGAGPALVLAHAGIAERRMWDDQFLVFAEHFRVIRFDFWGHGNSKHTQETFAYHHDLYELLKLLGVERAHLLGCSLGGRVVIDLALVHPEIVSSLILVGPGLSGYDFGGEVLDQLSELTNEAAGRNDVDAIIELHVHLWTDGWSRPPDQVDPRIRARAREMLLNRTTGEAGAQPLEPPAIGRLSEIAAPTLIVLGELDESNLFTIADLLIANIHRARKIVIPNAAHLPNMEEPERFNQIVLEFLQGTRLDS